MNSKITDLSIFLQCLTLVLVFSFSGFGQNKENSDLVSSYKEYTELPREISYAHLNKTTYLKGEIMGFTVYVFDKLNKKPSPTTRNIYCTISDEKNRIVKSEMVLAANGTANGSFEIDSLYSSGQYTFKAYTNWMRNFDEQNYYVQNIKVIDSEVEDIVKNNVTTSKLDAQFLPEGGHFVADVKNSVGVIIKDSIGFGVPDVTGKVVDSKNNKLTDFETNGLGIGKFTFLPNTNELYKVVLNFNGTEQTFPIEKPENQGIALTVNDLENRVALSFRTNENTLKLIKKKNYTLAIHNGAVLRTVNVNFGKSLEIVKIINYEDLSTGINIFTLFDDNNHPILERLFFKYDGIKLLSAQNPQIVNSKDSLTIAIPINNINQVLINNFSVSVLPSETKSYNPNNNIISEAYLQPYIKSYIENAAYYFTEITRKKKFELDHVLLTQGWSSYDWNTIFNKPPQELYEYENGISFRANVNDKTASEYMMYASINNEMEIFDLSKGEKDFGAVGLYPMEAEKARFSAIKKNKNIERSNLYLQFSPSTIPNLNIGKKAPAPLSESTTYLNRDVKPMYQSSWEKREKLKEVIVTTHKELERADKLNRVPYGKVEVFDDLKRKTTKDFASYIRTQGFIALEGMGSLKILNRRPVSIRQESIGKSAVGPIVYLDNIRLSDTNILYKYNMDNIDYIYINKSGAGEGGDAAAGVIKIFTDPTIDQGNTKRNVTQEIAVPLTFSTLKKFYTPEYTSYQSRFYQNYGVIGWFPRLSIQDDGKIHFTIPHQQIDGLSIFIEGTANDGGFISEKKTLTVP
ncbi:MAG: hypothetical protein ACTIJ9_00255 [Aequorivita sp.]